MKKPKVDLSLTHLPRWLRKLGQVKKIILTGAFIILGSIATTVEADFQQAAKTFAEGVSRDIDLLAGHVSSPVNNANAIVYWQIQQLHPDTAEFFQISLQHYFLISSLKADNGRYLSVQANDNVGAIDLEPISSTETFKIVSVGTETVAFEATSGKYLSVQADGRVKANSTQISQSEAFKLILIDTEVKVAFQTAEGKYLSAQVDGRVEANSTQISQSEIFSFSEPATPFPPDLSVNQILPLPGTLDVFSTSSTTLSLLEEGIWTVFPPGTFETSDEPTWTPTTDYSVQILIDKANHGDSVILSEGTHPIGSSNVLDFKGKLITLKSINGRDVIIAPENGGTITITNSGTGVAIIKAGTDSKITIGQ